MAALRPKDMPAASAVAAGDIFLIDGSAGVRALAASSVVIPIGTLYASTFGVVGDGTTVNTTAFNAAMAAFPASGGTLIMPPGICLGVFAVTKPVIVQGQGMGYVGAPTGAGATELRSTGAADNILTFSANGGGARDLLITSSVAAASRTGAGLKIGPIQGIEVRNVVSNGHKYGFWNTAPGNTLTQCYASNNNTYGLYLDGTTNAQSEIEIYYSQFNSNTTGVGIGGTGIGIFTTRLTSANNTSYGVLFEPGSTISDVYFTQPEISTNGLDGVNAINNTGANLEFDGGGVIEVLTGAGNAISTGTGQSGLRVRNTYLSGASTVPVFVIQGADTTINNNKIISVGTGTFAFNIVATATNVNINGNTLTASGTAQTGILINSGATLVRFANNILNGYSSNVNNGSTSATNVIQNNSSTLGNQDTQTGVTGNVTVSTALGSLFTGTLAVTFAKPFTSVPKVVVSPFAVGSSGGISASVDATTTTGFALRGVGITTGGAFACNYIASQLAF
ncbi:MAG: Pectate lyase superfamily protein [Bradyrhizobium sp.]|nr:Pectate lyase superfamily protein [Bradyrhizobium sp.]